MALKKIFVKPAPGLRVRMSHKPKEFLKSEGEYVPATAEWLRSVKSGDCLLVSKTAETKTKKA